MESITNKRGHGLMMTDTLLFVVESIKLWTGMGPGCVLCGILFDLRYCMVQYSTQLLLASSETEFYGVPPATPFVYVPVWVFFLIFLVSYKGSNSFICCLSVLSDCLSD